MTGSKRRTRTGFENGRHANAAVWIGVMTTFACLGCRQDMHDQPRYKPLARSEFFGDERSARPRVPGTVARGHLPGDPAMETGKAGTGFVAAVPVAIDMKLLQRGQDRYRIYCTPCHGQVGRGDGMIVRRGYRQPPSFHIDRLRAQPAGYFFDVMTAGFGAMPDYADKLSVADRWAVVAYIRALQLSENATVADVPAARRGELGGTAPAPAAAEAHHP
jgi:mono/diheme cytochrome c family protein